MKKRKSIRMKAAEAYIFGLSVKMLPIGMLFALVAYVVNGFFVKNLFAFFAFEYFALLLYVFISIYIDERKISQEIAKGVYDDKEALELITLHKYNDIELVIPASNLELLESSPKKYMFLNQTQSIELYKSLISKENGDSNAYLLHMDSRKINISTLEKYYFKKSNRYYLM